MMYYAMIDGQQKGPYSLEQLLEIGIRPGTYVWCKGMADWQRADEVADICRAYRQHIVSLQHPSHPQVESQPDNNQEQTSIYEPLFDPAEPDPATPLPAGMLPMAILISIFCFLPTGLVAIYYAIKARKFKNEADASRSKNSRPLYSRRERDDLDQQMCDAIRYYKMWMGITLFLGIISFGLLMSA